MSRTARNVCFIVPNYNHGDTLMGVLKGLVRFGHKIFVIDDGSDFSNQEVIAKACTEIPNVELFRHESNRGKGGAVSTGFRLALEQGFTHAIQVDGDGQHDLEKIAELLSQSQQRPEAVICGRPVYDESVPKARLWGRYLTHVWVWIETLSLQIQDSMCGFRCYPLAHCREVLNYPRLGRRMDFDTEILVRLHWQGVPMVFIPVHVIYPIGGRSNFRMWQDNALISWMHTRLVFGMLFRLPHLLARKIFVASSDETSNWARMQEVGTVTGIRILLVIYAALGRRLLSFILYPVTLYYYSFNAHIREASLDYIHSLKAYSAQNHLPEPKVTVFQHMYHFSLMMLDKLAAWRGDVQLQDLDFPEQMQFHKAAQNGKGIVFLTSHLGNPDVLRALVRNFPDLKVNVVVYFENSKKFTAVLKGINQSSHLNIIPVETFTIETAMRLQQMVEQGEWVYITGDRIPYTQNEKITKMPFLGREAAFPAGPFILGHILGVPIYSMHCYREGNKFVVRTKALDRYPHVQSSDRKDRIRNLTKAYVEELEATVLSAPTQWFNFYKFWQTQ